MTAREQILDRITRATAGDVTAGNAAAQPRADQTAPGYRTRSELAEAPLLDLLSRRLTDCRALVRRASAATLAAETSEALARRRARTVVVPPELGAPLPPLADVIVDDGLTAAELDAVDGLITRALRVAIAETGTIVLHGAPDHGRRANLACS